ncbi:acyltransferase family protein [Umezawaea beigongshangensis]|uniref:acyltransferase family protein n=1 Tax=Umezawaea beigongshangensis TaxID=2780383 RepID=UPI0018F2288A|nr:acyltransferase [Umezawaea beigongshangensis]
MTTPTTPPTAGGGRSEYLHGLDVLRVVASAAIVYTHLASWISGKNRSWPIGDLVNAVTSPLHLRPDLAFIGVASFLLVSGLVVTRVSLRESPGEFLRRRAVRVLPPLWAALILAFAVVSTGLVREMAPESAATALHLLNNAWFGPYFVGGAVLLPVVWTLLVQLAFYAFTALTIPLLRRWPWLPSAVAAALISVTTSLVPQGAVGPVRTVVAFLPIVFIGQLISLAQAGRVRLGAAVALGAVHLLLFVRADLVSRGIFTPGGGYHNVLLMIVLLVLLFMSANGPVARSRWTRALARRTYSVYLVHMPIGFAVLELLVDAIGASWALLISVLVIAVATELFYRAVERPLERLLRRRRRRRADLERPVDTDEPTPGGNRDGLAGRGADAGRSARQGADIA